MSQSRSDGLLLAATPTQRRNVRIVEDGRAVRWPDVDVDGSAFLACESIAVFPAGITSHW